MDFEFLILGTDPNAYYMARCVYEEYHKKAYVIGACPLAFTTYSSILHVSYNAKMWEEKEFLKVLKDFSKNHPGKNFLIATNETYIEFISKNKSSLEEYYYFNYPSVDIIETFTNKEKFYKTYQDSKLSFPNTLYLDSQEKLNLPEDFSFPLIVKPANVVIYNHISFEGKKKIFKIASMEELEDTITRVRNGGYNDKLIIQEFIPGGDDALFDAVLYANCDGKVEFMSFAQIGLQERTSFMVGNAAVLINGFNTTNGDVKKEIAIIKEFMEGIHYQGFAEVDLKYDVRDNTFKVLEINARQGRSSYYVAALGKNLARVLVNDCVNNERNTFEVLDKEVLLSFVPKGVVKKYITNEEYKKKTLQLWSKVVKPMDCREDHNLKRFLMLRKRWHSYYKEYENSYWRD